MGTAKTDDVTVSAFEDGQVYVTMLDGRELHAVLEAERVATIQVGAEHRITLDKMYGPMVFWSIRVTLDTEANDWVIEREMGPEGKWVEWARVPGCLESDMADPS